MREACYRFKSSGVGATASKHMSSFSWSLRQCGGRKKLVHFTYSVMVFTGPTMTLQEIVHPWYKVLLIWWGSFSTKYDLSPAITTNSTKNLQLISQVHSLSEKYRQIKNCNGLTLNWSMC